MIQDSGARREFDSGAVRDIQEGKGRMDLCPIDVFADILHRLEVTPLMQKTSYPRSCILSEIYDFMQDFDTIHLHYVIYLFAELTEFSIYDLFIEVSKHFEEGAKKYGEHNWEKGIPNHCYVDSALRHFFKYLRGDNDERHDRAFIWNILCLIWNTKHRPDLNDIVCCEVTNESTVLQQN